MTYDELVEKVAKIVVNNNLLKVPSRTTAEEIIDTIREVLMEPTPAMEVVVSKNWGRRTWAEYRDVLAASPLGEKSE